MRLNIVYECESSAARKSRVLLGASICVAWTSCSVAPIGKYLHFWLAVSLACVAISLILVGLYGVEKFVRRRRALYGAWLLALYLLFVTAFAVCYPFLQKHTLNGGSDREDALRIELIAIAHHQYPYEVKTFLGNLPTPLPGAMVLATPFYLIGHIAWQNLLWLGLFLLCSLRMFRSRMTAGVFLVVFVAASPSNLSDFVSGGDYLTNFFYFAVAITLFSRSLNRSLVWSLPAAIFLGIALSSRSIYFVAIVPLGVLVWQRMSAVRAATLMVVVVATTTAVTLSVFFPHPIAHLLVQLRQGSGKLRYMPHSLHAQWTLPALALLISFASVFFRMSLARLFLIFSMSTCAVVLPPIVTLALHAGRLPFECSYLAICALPYGLWALSRYEALLPSITRQSCDNWLTTT